MDWTGTGRWRVPIRMNYLKVWAKPEVASCLNHITSTWNSKQDGFAKGDSKNDPYFHNSCSFHGVRRVQFGTVSNIAC